MSYFGVEPLRESVRKVMQSVEKISTIAYTMVGDKFSIKVYEIDGDNTKVAYTYFNTLEGTKAWLEELVLLYSSVEPTQK